MSNLGPQRINQSFGDLLQLPNGLTSSLQAVQDGSGNVTPLQISNTDVQTTFIQAGTGAVMRTMQNKARENVSVLDFGAHSTDEPGYETFDSTAAIQAAINAVGDGVLEFPPGNYKTTAKIYTSYGQNIRIVGGDIYSSVTITAYHADHIFEYKFTIHIDGITFLRDSAYQTAAISAQKNGIHSDDTGGIIGGAAYTYIENCVVGAGSYVGIRMHGTHQLAINNVANSCIYGFYLLGSVHTLIHNATEENANAAVYINGNGHRLLSHYADGNCTASAPNHGVITILGAYNYVANTQMNDNNGAQHYYVAEKNNAFGNANMYNSTAYPRATITSFANTFHDPVIATVTGPDGYQNYFHPRSSYVSGNSFNDFGPIYSIEGYAPTIPSGSTNYILTGGQPVAAAISAQYVLSNSFVGLLKNAELEILGVVISANGAGVSNNISGIIKVRDILNNSDLTTLITFSADEQYGYTQTAEGAEPTTALTTIPINQNNSFPIYLVNTGGTTINNFFYKIIYKIKSQGAYA